jgi:hypothetical protein
MADGDANGGVERREGVLRESVYQSAEMGAGMRS